MVKPSRSLCAWLTAALLAGVSAARAEVVSPGGCREASISGEGRFVVFSTLGKLSADDTNGVSDIYLKDRVTKSLRRVSTNPGGDRPIITADGRVVIYRGLELFPKHQLVELRRPGILPRTIAHSFNNNSLRYSEYAAVSPEGRFVAFSFPPILSRNSRTDPILAVTDSTAANQVSTGTAVLNNLVLGSVGRVALSRNGVNVFYETSDALLPGNDTNGRQDIYFANTNNSNVVRLSAATGVTDFGGAHHPVINSTNDSVFFLTDKPLKANEPIQLGYLYKSAQGTNFQTPTLVRTAGVRPFAMSTQGTGSGAYVVFLGQNAAKALLPYIVRVSDGSVRALGSSALSLGGEPAISADDATIVFTDAAGSVTVVGNPFAGAKIAGPTVVLAGATDGAVLTEGTSLNLTATASPSAGTILSTAIEVDGEIKLRSSSATAQLNGLVLPRGDHFIRALALNSFEVPNQLGAGVDVTVRPVDNSLKLSGISSLVKAGAPGQAITFAGNVRIDNTFSTASQTTRIVLTQAPGVATWENFGNKNPIADRVEELMTIIPASAAPAEGTLEVRVTGKTRPPEVRGFGFEGVAWTIRAKLQELVGGTWTTRDTLPLFQVLPVLDEETPGPNGGAVQPGTTQTNGNFNPNTVTTLTVNGPPAVSGLTATAFTSIGTFAPNNATLPVASTWTLVSGADAAAISTTGVLVSRAITAARTVVIRATLNGTAPSPAKTATFNVMVRPVSPAVGVLGLRSATENGTNGIFRILRSPITPGPLTLTYTVSGTALVDQDYQALSGTATIPAGSSFVDVPVVALDDGGFTGNRPITIELQPSSDYRLGSAKIATIYKIDDEPVSIGLPDTVLVAGRVSVGSNIYEQDQAVAQKLGLGAIVNKPVGAIAGFVNRTTQPATYTIRGGGDTLGYIVQYFVGATNVTAAVVAGTFQYPSTAPGGIRQMLIRITPTANAPLNSTIISPINASTGGQTDEADLVVKRLR